MSYKGRGQLQPRPRGTLLEDQKAKGELRHRLSFSPKGRKLPDRACPWTGKGLEAHIEDTVQTKHRPYARGEENEVRGNYGGYRLGTVYKTEALITFQRTGTTFPKSVLFLSGNRPSVQGFWGCGSVSREDTVTISCK